jgi:hypothetical protein
VAMSAQYRFQLQAARIEKGYYRRGFARIDYGGMAVVVDRPYVIVL